VFERAKGWVQKRVQVVNAGFSKQSKKVTGVATLVLRNSIEKLDNEKNKEKSLKKKQSTQQQTHRAPEHRQ